MIRRALLLTDGPSDTPLGEHLAVMCAERGVDVRVSAPDLRRLPKPPGLKVADRLRAVEELDGQYDLVFVHRDAEKQDPQLRFDEVHGAVNEVLGDVPAVPVVPIRMTEAWLLLDLALIREVAGRPDASSDLGVPPTSKVESLPDPKSVLRAALDKASGLKGRKLKQLQNRFGESRRLLLERLDIHGPVRDLAAWQALEEALDEALAQLGGADAGTDS